MEADKSLGDGGSSRASSFVKKGERMLFHVDLRPGETTIVSWKKLLKDAKKLEGSAVPSENPTAVAKPGLETRLSPEQSTDVDPKDAPPSNRFSAVIQKIERLYVGNNSSDEEDLDDIPDDDQYDTEDSFIDDTELDEYFEVDKSSLKHDGFFVNRGKLEQIELPVQTQQQPKKRRRKDLGKAPDSDQAQSKPPKVGKTTALVGKNLLSPSQSPFVATELVGSASSLNQLNASETSAKKKAIDSKMALDSSSLSIVSGGDLSLPPREQKDIDKQKTANAQSKDLSNKLKDVAGVSDASHKKFNETISGRPGSNVGGQEPSGQLREKNGTDEPVDQSISGAKYPMQSKSQHIPKKDSSSVRPKISMLEKAIRELEKTVAESRPPAMENQEGDAATQAVKRRLPREIKLKLAKVARLAQANHLASHGKISKELLNRLMSILGHLIQLRSLKRNLKVMISMGLSAKQEKEDKFQQIKRELVDMIKAGEQHIQASEDFQELGSDEKGPRRKLSINTALEDKICDLYDLYVDGLDEDAGPQIRKLYTELAQLWPNALMDNHGIKRAICRAKDRRRALHSRSTDQEKVKKRRVLTTREGETVSAEAGSIAQPQCSQERLSISSSNTSFFSASGNRPIPSATTSARMPGPLLGSSTLDRPRQEKSKGNSSNPLGDAKAAQSTSSRKKVKRKPETNLHNGHAHQEKSPYLASQEKFKSSPKQATALSNELNLQTTVSSFKQSS